MGWVFAFILAGIVGGLCAYIGRLKREIAFLKFEVAAKEHARVCAEILRDNGK